MPRHVNPTRDRTATAPYNFVPLPERVFDVADGIEVAGEKIKPWEVHDRFVPGTNSGSIELTIETLTPLFIRGAVGQRQDGAWDDRDSRLRPDPYMTPDGHPAIPGSSLRGMVRTLVEILSFSKIQPVDDGKPFFRTVADDRIGRTYRSRMTAGGGKPCGGILRQSELGATIEPRDVFRVRREALGDIQFAPNPNYTPPWPQQHGRCWVKVGAHSLDVSEIRLQEQQPTGSGWRAATLVLTGNAPRKKREFVFLEPEGTPRPAVRVPDTVLTRFHDEDQITSWQERAFPRDRPAHARRRAAGHLRHDEPVFFLLSVDQRSEGNPEGLVFLGRAGMFRFPYDCSPADLVPEELRDARLDVAEAMFGKVDTSGAIKGRVHFEDAVATAGGPPSCEAALVPRILSAPKPTSFQHYLTQDGTRGREQLTTYIDGDQTTIRGHKLFWHRDDGSGVAQIREAGDHDRLLRDLRGANPQDTQHTIIQPVRRGVTFGGRVRFENLTDLELGALLCALQLPEGCAHRLGLGKPLGLGSVRITADLRLVDRGARYRAWQSSGVQGGEDGGRFRSAFGEAILEHARISQEPLQNGQQGLRQIARLDALMHVLEWTNRPLPAATAYMNLDGFRNRPVLPTPHSVAGASEPPWPADSPQPASDGAGREKPRSARPDRTAGRQDARRSTSSRRQETSAPRPAQPPTGVKVGDTVEVVLLEEKTKKGGWKGRHEASGLEGPIQNSSLVPADKRPGDRLTVLVKIAKQRESAFEVPPEGHGPGTERKAGR